MTGRPDLAGYCPASDALTSPTDRPRVSVLFLPSLSLALSARGPGRPLDHWEENALPRSSSSRQRRTMARGQAINTRSGYLSPRPPLPRDVHVRPRHVRDKMVARRKQAEPRKRRREGVLANFLGPVDLGEEIATQARRLHARYATGPSPRTFFPFGGGVRRCLGAACATYEMKVVLAEVLSRAELRVAPGYRPHVVRRAVTLAASDGVPVVLVARSACGRCQRPEVEEAARRGFSTGASLPSAARRSA
jgi:hypothetical protein